MAERVSTIDIQRNVAIMTPAQADLRYRQLCGIALASEQSDELKFLAIRLGKTLIWQHKLLGIDSEWATGRGR